MEGGRLLGKFMAYYDRPHAFTDAEIGLGVTIARQLGLSIERVQTAQAAQQFVAIVESSDDAIISKDLNGIIRTWNPAAERIFGYTAKEAVGQPVTILIPPERLDEEPHILARIRSGERIDHYETVRRRKDGASIDISLTVSPVRNAAGQIVGASKISRDISDRKAAEAKAAGERAAPAGPARRHSGRDLHHRRRRQDHLFQPGGGRARRPHARRSAATNGA